MDIQQLYDGAIDFIWNAGPSLVLTIVALLVGFWIIKLISKGVGRAMDKAKIEESLKRFLLSLISITLKILLLISVVSMLGVATTSFVAVLGAAGLAIGLSLQGSLSNFAGGILIILFKPFKVGDVIDAQGYLGSVNEIWVLPVFEYIMFLLTQNCDCVNQRFSVERI
ncbi:MAG: mechanosensitive ion channel, partial [Calditrichaceae bacterium]|nr:mechanosensitive ion channel [Calditrichaceae bacterium]